MPAVEHKLCEALQHKHQQMDERSEASSESPGNRRLSNGKDTLKVPSEHKDFIEDIW